MSLICSFLAYPCRMSCDNNAVNMGRNYFTFVGEFTVDLSETDLCDYIIIITLQWLHNRRDDVSNHQPHDYLLSRLFGRRSKKTSKLRVTGLCAGNSPGIGEFPAQMASNAEMFPFYDVTMILFVLLWTMSCFVRGSYNNAKFQHRKMFSFRDIKFHTWCLLRNFRLGQLS